MSTDKPRELRSDRFLISVAVFKPIIRSNDGLFVGFVSSGGES